MPWQCGLRQFAVPPGLRFDDTLFSQAAAEDAGVGGAHRRLHELETQAFDNALATNLRGTFLRGRA